MTVRVPKPTLKLTPSVSTDGQLGSQCSQRGQSSESSRRMFGQRASVEKPAPAAAAPEMALTAAAVPRRLLLPPALLALLDRAAESEEDARGLLGRPLRRGWLAPLRGRRVR